MNKNWDHHKGGRDRWIAWLQEILEEVYRVLKPGAHGLIWALPRTSHWASFAAENAGFEIIDIVHHLFGSGMPMGLNISKAFDRSEGKGHKIKTKGGKGTNSTMYRSFGSGDEGGEYEELLPESDLAQEWFGWHTRLKPAAEHWILVQKRHRGSVINTIKEWRTGGLNIEASRVPANDGYEKAWDKPVSTNVGADGYVLLTMAQHKVDISEHKPSGRFPANLVLSHHAECIILEVLEEDGVISFRYECHEDCPVQKINEQGGESISRRSQRGQVRIFNQEVQSNDQWIGESTERGFNDSGGKARFFNTFESHFAYLPRVAPSEKRFYCQVCDEVFIGTKYHYEAHKDHGIVAHPTPKSKALMKWLITLITPPGGIVLDPFFGTGSTGVACQELGFDCVGIDLDEEDGYLKIAQSRVDEAAA